MKPITKELLQDVFKKKSYIWQPDKVNIVGIRSNDNTPDKFNDYICISYKDEFHIFNATADPGVYWLQNPERVSGTFVMMPGQYVDSWQIGIHKTYKALTQCKTIRGWRDSNKDNLINPDLHKVYTDGQGVDIHHAHETVIQTVIDKYSAGCQVIQKFSDWLIFFGLCEIAKQNYYTYTLITENDL